MAMQEVQLRDARIKLSALVEDAAQGQTVLITRHGEPRAVIVGIDQWKQLHDAPSFGRLLSSAPMEDGDVPSRDTSPPRDAAL